MSELPKPTGKRFVVVKNHEGLTNYCGDLAYSLIADFSESYQANDLADVLDGESALGVWFAVLEVDSYE